MEINIYDAISKLGLDIKYYNNWSEVTKQLILKLLELQDRIEKLENKT